MRTHWMPSMGEWGVARPGLGRVEADEPDGGVRVWTTPVPLLNEGFVVPPQVERGAALVAWSGGFGGGEGDALFEPDPRTWNGRGFVALAQRLAGLRAVCKERGVTVWIRPHHRHVVSDAPSVLKVVKECGEGGQIGVVPDPAAMVSQSMLGLAAEHLVRMGELLTGIGVQSGVVLGGLTAGTEGGDGRPRLEALDSGGPAGRVVWPVKVLLDAAVAMAATGGLLLLSDRERVAQRSALRGGAGVG